MKDETTAATTSGTSTTALLRIRERFRSQPESSSPWQSPRRAWRFLRLAIGKAQKDKLIQQSASLAYITIVSLIPLLATFSFIGSRAFTEQQGTLVELLSQLLPYSEAAILEALREFLEHARTLRGASFLFFLLTAIAAFMTIEETLNRIWNVPKRRPLRTRLLSFTLLLFWGPLVLGATYSGLFFLGRQPAFEALAASVPLQLVPSLITVLALSMLYWLVPYATVRFRSALLGGVVAAALLEVLRRGFSLYIAKATAVSVVYGSLGLAIFFMVSIQAMWWIVLLGSETAYCAQHYSRLSHRRWKSAPLEGSWLALAAIASVGERFRGGQPITTREELAERLHLPTEELLDILGPVVEEGLLHQTPDGDGYLLGGDPHDLEVGRVFEIFERFHWQMLEDLPAELEDHLEGLRARLNAAREKALADLRLVDLTTATALTAAATE